MTNKPKNSAMIKVGRSITLCAIDSVTPLFAAKALQRSSQTINFDEIILFSHSHPPGPHKFITIPQIHSISDYNNFIIKDLNKYINTEFVLIVQWDGYVINPHLWMNEFLNYDYIGARWPQYYDEHNVGNGGFSLRSKKLLTALQKIKYLYDSSIPEDELICRKMRGNLENDFHISFAPCEIADKFSYEQTIPTHKTFGFHGFWNMLNYIEEDECLDIISSLPNIYFNGYLMIKTFMSSYFMSKTEVMIFIYAKIITKLGEDTLYKTLVMALKFNKKDVSDALNISRRLLIRRELSNSNNRQ